MKKKGLLKGMCIMAAAAMMCTGFSTVASAQEAGEKVTVNFWGYSRHNLDLVQSRIDLFNEQNPDIEVVYQVMTENYDNNLELSFQSNQAPDVFTVKGGTVVPYVKKDMAAPIDAYITDDIKERYGESLQVDGINTYKDNQYSLADFGNPMRLIYNKDVFEKAGLDPETPPTTLEELREYAKTITEKLSGDGVYGFAMNMKASYSALFRSVDQCAFRSGCNPYNYETGEYDFTGYGEVVKVFQDMYADGSFFPGAESLDIDPLRAQFALGNIGMYMSGYWEVGVYDSQFPTEQEWAAAPMPTLDGEAKGKTNLDGAGASYMISSKTEHPEEAWRFIEFMLQDDYLADYHEKGLGITVVPSAAAVAKDSDKYGSNYFKVRDDEEILPAAPHNAGMSIEGNTYWDVFNAAIMGGDNIDECVQELNQQYNDTLKKAIENGDLEPIIIK